MHRAYDKGGAYYLIAMGSPRLGIRASDGFLKTIKELPVSMWLNFSERIPSTESRYPSTLRYAVARAGAAAESEF